MPICKDQQIAYFLLINNVPYFEETSIPFLSNNNLFNLENIFSKL